MARSTHFHYDQFYKIYQFDPLEAKCKPQRLIHPQMSQIATSNRYKLQGSKSYFVQTRWRGHRSSSHYKSLKKGAIVAQCRWRGKLARRELRKRKMVCFNLYSSSKSMVIFLIELYINPCIRCCRLHGKQVHLKKQKISLKNSWKI